MTERSNKQRAQRERMTVEISQKAGLQMDSGGQKEKGIP